MGKKNRTVRPKYGSKVRISKLKPLFKEKYINLDDTIKLSEKEVLAGGWLNKILRGVASPKCGEIIGKPEDWYGLIRTGLKDFLRLFKILLTYLRDNFKTTLFYTIKPFNILWVTRSTNPRCITNAASAGLSSRQTQTSYQYCVPNVEAKKR